MTNLLCIEKQSSNFTEYLHIAAFFCQGNEVEKLDLQGLYSKS